MSKVENECNFCVTFLSVFWTLSAIVSVQGAGFPGPKHESKVQGFVKAACNGEKKQTAIATYV